MKEDNNKILLNNIQLLIDSKEMFNKTLNEAIKKFDKLTNEQKQDLAIWWKNQYMVMQTLNLILDKEKV